LLAEESPLAVPTQVIFAGRTGENSLPQLPLLLTAIAAVDVVSIAAGAEVAEVIAIVEGMAVGTDSAVDAVSLFGICLEDTLTVFMNLNAAVLAEAHVGGESNTEH